MHLSPGCGLLVVDSLARDGIVSGGVGFCFFDVVLGGGLGGKGFLGYGQTYCDIGFDGFYWD